MRIHLVIAAHDAYVAECIAAKKKKRKNRCGRNAHVPLVFLISSGFSSLRPSAREGGSVSLSLPFPYTDTGGDTANFNANDKRLTRIRPACQVSHITLRLVHAWELGRVQSNFRRPEIRDFDPRSAFRANEWTLSPTRRLALRRVTIRRVHMWLEIVYLYGIRSNSMTLQNATCCTFFFTREKERNILIIMIHNYKKWLIINNNY